MISAVINARKKAPLGKINRCATKNTLLKGKGIEIVSTNQRRIGMKTSSELQLHAERVKAATNRTSYYSSRAPKWSHGAAIMVNIMSV